ESQGLPRRGPAPHGRSRADRERKEEPGNRRGPAEADWLRFGCGPHLNRYPEATEEDMRTLKTALLTALLATGFAGVLHADAAEALFTKTHKGAKESKVAGDWYDSLPAWVASLTSKNQFPTTQLPFDFDRGKLK